MENTTVKCETYKISDLFEIIRTRFIIKTAISNEFTGLITQPRSRNLFPSDAEKYEHQKIKKGDILLRRAFDIEAFIGKENQYAEEGVYILRSKKLGIILPEYIVKLFNYKKEEMKNYLMEGTIISRIQLNRLENLSIPVPSLNIQNLINEEVSKNLNLFLETKEKLDLFIKGANELASLKRNFILSLLRKEKTKSIKNVCMITSGKRYMKEDIYKLENVVDKIEDIKRKNTDYTFHNSFFEPNLSEDIDCRNFKEESSSYNWDSTWSSIKGKKVRTKIRKTNENEVLICSSGKYIGETITSFENRCWGHRIISISPDQSVLDNNYLFFFMKAIKNTLISLTEGVGIWSANLTTKMLEGIEIPLVERNIQKAIGKIHKKEDDRISLIKILSSLYLKLLNDKLTIENKLIFSKLFIKNNNFNKGGQND